MEKQLSRESRPGHAKVRVAVSMVGLVFLTFGAFFAVRGNWVSVVSCAVVVGGSAALLAWIHTRVRAPLPGESAAPDAVREPRRFTVWELTGHIGMAGLYVGGLLWSAVTADSMGALIAAACVLVALGELAWKLQRSDSLHRNDVLAALL